MRKTRKESEGYWTCIDSRSRFRIRDLVVAQVKVKVKAANEVKQVGR